MGRHVLREQVIKERKARSKTLLLVLLIISGFLVYNFFFGDMGYIKYRQLKNNELKLVNEINNLSAENAAIKKEIELLKNDPLYLEKYVREQYGLVKPGEMVFQFKNEEK